MNNIAHAPFLKGPETKILIAAFQAAGQDIRFVGGCVRDALLNKTVTDIDVCTPALPEQVEELLRDASIRAIPTGIDHGTITALIGKRTFEITTLRKDVACDGRHAEVEYSNDYAEDAARRDFTINALSADIEGKVYDYHQGIDDLQAKILRFIGDAGNRITEDGLRILRLFRFQAQLGFEIDKHALEAAGKLKGKLKAISRERICVEMLKLLSSANPQAALKHMADTSVLSELFAGTLHSEITPLLTAETALDYPLDALTRFAYLVECAQNARADARHFKELLALSNQQAKKLEQMLAHKQDIPPSIHDAERKRLQRGLGSEIFLKALLLNAAKHPQEMDIYKDIKRKAGTWELPEFPLSGADLLALGLQPGKQIGDMLFQLEQIWENSDYRMGREELLKKLSPHA